MIILVYFSIYIDYSILIFSPIFFDKIIPEVRTKLGVLKIIPLQRVRLKLGQLRYTLQNKFGVAIPTFYILYYIYVYHGKHCHMFPKKIPLAQTNNTS